MNRLIVYTLFFLLIFPQVYAQDTSDLLNKAKAEYQKKDFRMSLYYLNQYIDLDSLNPEAYKFRGNCNYEINQTTQALADYQAAIKLDSSYHDAYYNIGNLYESQEMFDSAAHYFKQYLISNPDDSDGHVRLAQNLLFMNEEEDQSLALFEKAYDLDTTNLNAIQYLMQYYFYDRDIAKSLSYAQKGLLLDASNIDFFLYSGLAHLYQKDFQKAIYSSEKALKIDSLSFDALSLNIQARIFSKTDTFITTQNADYQLKFNDYTSKSFKKAVNFKEIAFEELQSQMKDGKTLGLDQYFEFYVAQSEQPGYSPYGQTVISKTINDLFEKENYEQLTAYTDKLLDNYPVSLHNLYRVSAACFLSGKTDDFMKVYTSYYGIMESILATGDGITAENAFIVMSTSDEYAVLNYLGLSSMGQSLTSADGHHFDVLKTVNEEGVEQDYYFNIDIPFNSLSKSFSGKKENKKKNKRKKRKKN